LNSIHRWLCRSAGWQKVLDERILPWVLAGVDLGEQVLEVGPGPGLTTDILRPRVQHLTAIEIDAALAQRLTQRLDGTNVSVVRGDATAMPFPDAEFSGAVSFTMLHHVPSPALQDKLLREVCRVLKPGAVFAGVDSRQSWSMKLIHIADTLVPVDPKSFPARLRAAGFKDPAVEINEHAFRFRARKPAAA
jgi:ubiquinone/menaquinone biosynthesis C-methylase UbiE